VEGSWLLLWLLVLSLLVVPARKLGPVQRRRLRRWTVFALGALLGGVALVGLVGLAVFALWGEAPLREVADRAARGWAQARQSVLPALRPGPAAVLEGPVTRVRDGDTIVVSGRPIRLSGLNCDERGTPLGDQATAMMHRLVVGQRVRCELDGERTHDREVGRCSLPNGEDLGAMMITLRLCGRCARHDPWRDYAEVQAEAGPYAGDTPGYCRSIW
jgi:endonuclease YncB( thermonuclease family)